MRLIEQLGYRTVETLYQSLNTVVYRAEKDTNEAVILKLLNDENPPPHKIARLQYEYNILSELAIPGVIKARSLLKLNKGYILEMEDTGGIPLSKAPVFHSGRNVQHDRESLIEKIHIFIDIAKTLGEIHRCHIIHKDINPSNILIHPESNQIQFIDFGLSTKRQLESIELNMMSVVSGTLAYISPEQTGRIRRPIDYRADYYSLGVTFYELLTGILPFQEKDPLEIIYSHIAKKPLSPHELDSDIPKPLSDIIMKLLEKMAEHRYGNIYGLVSDLATCLQQLEKKERIESFALGTQDDNVHFQVSPKIYGREEEVQQMIQAFDRVKKGSMELVLVSGFSGVGKTAIIEQVHEPILQARGLFISGKYDQYSREIPYSAILQACKELLRYVLSHSDEEVAKWRERITASLHKNGKLVIDLLPELEKVIGPQPDIPELPPSENQNRFLVTFGNFIHSFTAGGRPLAIFLDDLQWIDQPSLALIHYLLNRGDVHHLLMIGAYRENELYDDHPLVQSLNEVRHSKEVMELTIRPLEKVEVIQMVADTLHIEIREAEPLAALIYRRTEGNPFFSIQFLQSLYEEGMICYQETSRKWGWELGHINQMFINENVVDLIIQRIKKLSEESQETLVLASLIGNVFTLKTLAKVQQSPSSVIMKKLMPAIEMGILIPITKDYDLACMENSELDVVLKFHHDRIQQAAYSFFEEERREAAHLDIARILIKGATVHEIAEEAIQIVKHYNHAVHLITSDQEKQKVAELNFLACQKAKASTAYHQALKFIESCVHLLPSEAWQEQYEFIYRAVHLYAECAYLCNEFTVGEQMTRLLFQHAKTDIQKALIYKMQLEQYAFFGRMQESIEYGVSALKQLGFHIPSRPSKALIVKELISAKLRIRNKTTDQLATLPLAKDEKVILAMKIMLNFIPPAYLTGNEIMFAYVILKNLNLTLTHGLIPQTSAIYIGYTVLLAGLGDLRGAERFGKLAIRVSDQSVDQQWRGMTYVLYGLFSHSWNHDWSDMTEWFSKSIEAGLSSGEHLYMSFSCGYVHQWNPRLQIQEAINENKKYISLVRESKYKNAMNAMLLHQHRFLNFAGYTSSSLSMNTDQFTEKHCLDQMKQEGYLSGVAIYYIFKNQIFYMNGEIDRAYAALVEADHHIKALSGSPYIVEYRFFSLLTMIEKYRASEKKTRRGIWNRIKKDVRLLDSWAKHCPDNFFGKKLIAEAEIALLQERYDQAIKLYDQAIQEANKNGYLWDGALANERAGTFYICRGNNRLAKMYLKEAVYLYQMWGASAKVEEIMRRYPALFTRRIKDEKSITLSTTTTTDTVIEALELSTVIKASEVFLNEFHFPSLLKKIMMVVLEYSGAEKGYLILKQEETWSVEAEKDSPDGEITVLHSMPLYHYDSKVAKSVIQYVMRTEEWVVLEHASKENSYLHDQYMKMNDIKSLLCLPIMNKGTSIGLLYLENNLAPAVFTKERVKILELISTQIAISIENVKLYAHLESTNKKLQESKDQLQKWNYNLEKEVKKRTGELEQVNSRLKELTYIDGLTKVKNRRFFDQVFVQEREKAIENQSSLSILMVDIDQFKEYNDQYGHLQGDDCIRAVAALLERVIHGKGIVARYGGEEFAIIIPVLDQAEVEGIAEEIRSSVEGYRIPHEKSRVSQVVTVSIGIAGMIPDKNDSSHLLLHHADQALYRSKLDGRNRVTVYGKSEIEYGKDKQYR